MGQDSVILQAESRDVRLIISGKYSIKTESANSPAPFYSCSIGMENLVTKSSGDTCMFT